MSLDKFRAKWEANKQTETYNMHTTDISAEQSQCVLHFELT